MGLSAAAAERRAERLERHRPSGALHVLQKRHELRVRSEPFLQFGGDSAVEFAQLLDGHVQRGSEFLVAISQTSTVLEIAQEGGGHANLLRQRSEGESLLLSENPYRLA